MGHAEVDQARFLAAGDDFDGVPQRGFGGDQEALGRAQLADRVGRHRADPRRRQFGDALAEALQAGEGAVAHVRCQPAEPVQPLSHAHRFAQAVDHPQLAEHALRHHHVEAVGAEVERGQQVAVA